MERKIVPDIRQLRSLDLALQDDQLLAQQRMFYNRIGAAASYIGKNAKDQG